MQKWCFSVRLVPTGQLLFVHPITDGGDVFLPCTYGYATTIRRAQGSSLDMGCVFFDHCYPPERGYAYVAVSRFREARFVYHFGKIRRSDWLPVGSGEDALEQTMRSNASGADDSEFDWSSDGECYTEATESSCGTEAQSSEDDGYGCQGDDLSSEDDGYGWQGGDLHDCGGEVYDDLDCF